MRIALRSEDERRSTIAPRTMPFIAGQRADKSAQWYLCRACGHKITHPSEHRRIQGSHLHAFANPSGIVYEFCCFTNAGGCALIGPESSEFTWFAGHHWRIAVCDNCRNHLGWKFTSGFAQSFFGLISDRLTLASLMHR